MKNGRKFTNIKRKYGPFVYLFCMGEFVLQWLQTKEEVDDAIVNTHNRVLIIVVVRRDDSHCLPILDLVCLFAI